MSVIMVRNLKRDYETSLGIIKRDKKIINAIRDISFEVERGEIFGLLGPNGAGKTSTIKILTTLLAPTSGQAVVLGHNCFGEEKELRRKINFIFGGERSLYWRLSAYDNLSYFCDLYHVPERVKKDRIEKLLDMVGLGDKAQYKVETFSKGMKQRLQIARGLVNDPEVLFLDEPTIGLDPVGAKTLRKIIKQLSSEGKTILLTTHYMQEADELCDRIAIINKGKLFALNTSEKLKENIDSSVIEVEIHTLKEDTLLRLNNIEHVTGVDVIPNDVGYKLKIDCRNPRKIMSLINDQLSENNVKSILMREATLEDVYLKIIGGDYSA
ncbi:ABC-2 type transport system ATP-binding protein [Anaerosolibacter carboniphilus]|uniref:ABC-2 type transport system ATP-binding protein n=1 Tax=Anaerosolibacter carboniphilus TaxID=1417629 RepID=A0A841KRW0_9FIRM|nr:ATP-binding cassette domain-containing protein [Anaerosolibacter carboniphilus]MBB6216111.1 ABC-2 type transport system ATP-binding protein [Anaerosolibacter carboniphilus]